MSMCTITTDKYTPTHISILGIITMTHSDVV